MHPDIAPLDSVDHARWFVDALSGDLSVDGLVPPVFDAYVRILHPAEADDGRPVRWAEVADDQGTELHPSAWFARLARRRNGGRAHGWSGRDPWESSLDRRTLEVLVDVLASHTATPQAVWLNLWDGFGHLPSAWARLPRVDQENGYREYFAFRCRLDEVVAMSVRFEEIGWEFADDNESIGFVTAEYVGDGDPEDEVPPRHPDEPDTHLQSPQQWWPDDRAWAVATEIDDDYTIVAGPDALADALTAHPGLETVRIGPRDSLEDTVNPKPPR